jgi:hypothetical protein
MNRDEFMRSTNNHLFVALFEVVHSKLQRGSLSLLFGYSSSNMTKWNIGIDLQGGYIRAVLRIS